MSPLLILSAVVLLSTPWASSASCLCSVSGDPHITTCDTKTNFAWQGAGAYSLFKTPDTELQCDFDYPRSDNGSIAHQMFTYVSSCRISYKPANGCEFTMLTGGNNDQQNIYIGNTKMTLSEVKPFLQKNLPAMGVNLDVDVENAKTTCTMQTQQGPIAFELAPYQVHVTSASANQCSGMCGTCDGKAPLALTLSDAASIKTYAASFAADGSSGNQPIQLKPLPIQCLRNNGSTPTNGTNAMGQSSSIPMGSSSPLASNGNATPMPASAPSMPGSSPMQGSSPMMPGSSPMQGSSPSMSGSSPMQGSSPMMHGSSPMQGSSPSMPGSSPMQGSSPSMPGFSPMPGMAPMPASAPGSPAANQPQQMMNPSGMHSSTPMTSGAQGTGMSQSNNPSSMQSGMPALNMAPGSVADASSMPSFPTPTAVRVEMPNARMINDNPVFESADVLRKVVDQCLCGQPKTRYYTDAIFGRYFENCVYDKSFPGAEKLALSNMMTLHRAISKGFTSNNASMAPVDMNVCKSMILQPVTTKRPDEIPMGQGVSYIPIYTKQNSTGLPNLRPTVMTGTGEAVDECEINPATGALNVPSPAPTSMWNREQQYPNAANNQAAPSSSNQGGMNGMSMNGMSMNGMSMNGMSSNGMSSNGMSSNGMSSNGMSSNGMSSNGTMTSNDMNANNISATGMFIARGGLIGNGWILNRTNNSGTANSTSNSTANGVMNMTSLAK